MVRHGDLLKEAMIFTLRGPSTLSAVSQKENLVGGTFNGPQQIVYHRGPYTTIGEIIDCPKVPPSSLQYPNNINSLGNMVIIVIILIIIFVVVIVVIVIIVKHVHSKSCSAAFLALFCHSTTLRAPPGILPL